MLSLLCSNRGDFCFVPAGIDAYDFTRCQKLWMQEPFSPGLDGRLEGLDVKGGSLVDPDLVVDGYLEHMETATVSSISSGL